MTALKNKHGHRANNEYDLYGDIEKIKSAIREATRDVQGRTGEILSGSVENIKERASMTKDSMENVIAEHPFRSLGIALVAGIVIGFLLKK